MPSTKLENRILLCLVAFSVSCGIGLIANRDIVKALTTGAIATVASFVGGTVVDRKIFKQERLSRNSFKNKAQTLKTEIEQLEDYKEQLRQTLMTTTTVQEEIELSIHNLESQKDNLRDRVEQIQTQKQTMQQELTRMSDRKEELEQACDSLEAEFEQMNFQHAEFQKILTKGQAQILQNESCLTLLREEYQQLQDYVSEIYSQKDQLDRDLYELENKKQQLLGSVHDLQLYLTQLEEQERSHSTPEETTEEEDLPVESRDDTNVPDTDQTSPEWSDWDELLDSI
jgi:chromosome segregation ATPase